MRSLLLTLVLAAAAVPALVRAQTAEEAAERARIARERSQANAQLASEEVACYQKFAVSDCLNAARARRRDLLSDLRRQELTLNDADRKRKAGERVKGVEERNSAQRQEDAAAQRAQAMARQREKEADLARRTEERAQGREATPAKTARKQKQAPQHKGSVRAASEQRIPDSAEELRRYDQRQQDAQERRDRVAKRLAEPARPDLKPLPVPP
jgi:colicin import membrane protein